MTRCGIGYDAHPLKAGRRLVIGGVVIPYAFGLAGHSDADVLCHAIADAVLGGAGLGELGELCPADDPAWKDASSLAMLELVAQRLREHDLRVDYVDSVIVADAPRLREFRDAMRANVAAALGISLTSVSVKPKSNEGLGFVGAGAGLSAHAVATVSDIEAGQ